MHLFWVAIVFLWITGRINTAHGTLTIHHFFTVLISSMRFQKWNLWLLILPVQSNGREAEDCHGAEDFVQEFHDLAEKHGVDPPATVRTGAEDDVEGHAHQTGADTRAGQVFNEPVGNRFEHGCAAS